MSNGEVLLETGARVNQVDEEGTVTLFCYSLDHLFSFNVDSDRAREWGTKLGTFVTLRVTEETLEGKAKR